MKVAYMTTDYRCLRAYEGAEVTLKKWLWQLEDLHVAPAKVRIIRDYPRTILFELTYAGSEYGFTVPPRKILKLVSKAAMAAGDVIVKLNQTGELLTGLRMFV